MHKIIAIGILSWNSEERRSDRYGSVHITEDLDGDRFIKFPNDILDKKGKLFAIVAETRQSRHIGDLFRGIYPQTPTTGDRIELGEGTVFFENNSIGLMPDDGRDSDWLNPVNLYKLHEQTVALYFEPI